MHKPKGDLPAFCADFISTEVNVVIVEGVHNLFEEFGEESEGGGPGRIQRAVVAGPDVAVVALGQQVRVALAPRVGVPCRGKDTRSAPFHRAFPLIASEPTQQKDERTSSRPYLANRTPGSRECRARERTPGSPERRPACRPCACGRRRPVKAFFCGERTHEVRERPQKV